MQPRIQLATWAVSAHCWLMSSLSSTCTPKSFWAGAALSPFIPQPVLIPGVALTQVKDLALGLVEPHEVQMGPFLKLVQVPLDDIPSFLCVSHTMQLGVICKLTEGALDLTKSSVKMLNSTAPSTDP